MASGATPAYGATMAVTAPLQLLGLPAWTCWHPGQDVQLHGPQSRRPVNKVSQSLASPFLLWSIRMTVGDAMVVSR